MSAPTDAPTGPAELRPKTRAPETPDARIVWRLAQSPGVVLFREEHDAGNLGATYRAAGERAVLEGAIGTARALDHLVDVLDVFHACAVKKIPTATLHLDTFWSTGRSGRRWWRERRGRCELPCQPGSPGQRPGRQDGAASVAHRRRQRRVQRHRGQRLLKAGQRHDSGLPLGT